MSNGPARQVRLRRDLEHSRQQHQGKSYLVVKDPITRRYFRFTESQANILELLMSDPVDAVAIASGTEKRLGTAVSPVTIEAFLDSLEEKYLLDTPEVQDKLSTISSQKL